MTVRRTETWRTRGIKTSVHCTDACIKRLETFRHQSDHRIYRLNPPWSSSGPAAALCSSIFETATACPCLVSPNPPSGRSQRPPVDIAQLHCHISVQAATGTSTLKLPPLTSSDPMSISASCGRSTTLCGN